MKPAIAIVGATGALGRAILERLAESQLPCGQVFALASLDSAGDSVPFGRHDLDVQDVAEFDFSCAAIAVFAVPFAVAEQWRPAALAAGCKVLEYGAAPDCPRYVPSQPLAETVQHIACPDPLALLLAKVLNPAAAFGLTSIDVTVLESVSSSGQAALDELADQTMALFNQRGVDPSVFPARIAFNAFPSVRENQALADEMRQLCHTDIPKIHVSRIQTPLFFGSSLTLHAQTQAKPDLEALQLAFTSEANVQSVADGYAATPIDVIGSDKIALSQLRLRDDGLSGFSLWLSADNLRLASAVSVAVLRDWLAVAH